MIGFAMLYDVVEMVQREGWSIVAYLGSLAKYSKSRVLSVEYVHKRQSPWDGVG